MRRPVPAVRIWPMSDKIPGFRGRSIEDVQERLFVRDLPAKGGSFRYPVAGLNAAAGTVVLFQYRARVIASGVFLRDEKAEGKDWGVLQFEADSFQIFQPVDADGMRRAWPGFRRFGHVKQFLNPMGYAAFKRRLKRLESPRS